MREQADVIQKEGGLLLADVDRLDARVGKLETHFRQADDDIRQIRISAEKITRRGGHIREIEVGDPEAALESSPSSPSSLSPAAPQAKLPASDLGSLETG